MKKQQVLILDKVRISHKLQRMAYQIWEHNSDETAVTLIGIEGSGLAVAKNLATRIQKVSPLQVEVLRMKLNKRKPLEETITISQNLTGKSVVLVDDTAKILIAVLVDRKHKAFPVSPDIVGHSIATTLQEHIEVETSGDEITAAYLQ
jgi:pyrimidine operon attenuation protein/uracil phosphoribosyltransferase